MKFSRYPMLLAICLFAESCGSGGNSASPPPTPIPVPVPTPAPAPVLSSIVRLRTALPLGQELQVQPVAVQITNLNNKSYYADNAVTVVGHSDPRLRWLGGRFAVGTKYPATLAKYGQAITNGDITIDNALGLPNGRRGINIGIEFSLPANQSEFELGSVDKGDSQMA